MQTFEEYKKQFTSFDENRFAFGGFKDVYGARHSQYGDVVAKIITKVDERALREIEIVKDNNFSNVPKIYQVDEIQYNEASAIALIEQRIKGSDLRKYIQNGGRYNLREAVNFLKEAFSFVDDISKKNIVHRDIKPANIIKDNTGKYWFLDFGIARILGSESLTNTGEAPMSAGYAAPEVFRGDRSQITSQADLFSIGVVTYELITGENPYLKNAQTRFDVLMNTATITPVQHKVKGDSQSMFIGLVASLMNKNLTLRIKNAKNALDWLVRAEETFDYSEDN